MQGELEGLVTWLMSWIQGPYGMVVLSATTFAEASFLPVLPDVLLVALCLIDPPNAFLYAAICSVSSALGAFSATESAVRRTPAAPAPGFSGKDPRR